MVSYIKVLFLIFHEKVSWFTFLKVISLRGIISYTFFQFIFYCNHLYFLVTIKGIYIVGTWKKWLQNLVTLCNIIFHFFWFFWGEKKIWWMHVGSWVEQDNFLLLLPWKNDLSLSYLWRIFWCCFTMFVEYIFYFISEIGTGCLVLGR